VGKGVLDGGTPCRKTTPKGLKENARECGRFLYPALATLTVVHDAMRRRAMVHRAVVYGPMMDRTVVHDTVGRRTMDHVMALRCRGSQDGRRSESSGQGETSRKNQAFHGNPPLGNWGQLAGILLNEARPQDPAVWHALL
jgi:hypothetical protein